MRIRILEVDMPLVFVHGVSNRDTPEYHDNQLARNAFFKSLVAPALGLDGENLKVLNPYCGDQGVRFRWGNASLPESAPEIETFGSEFDPADLRIAADVLAEAPPDAPDIVAVANRSLAEAIDIIWSTALPAAATQAQAKALAESYRSATAYAKSNPKPKWIATAKPGNLIDQLLANVEVHDNTGPANPGSGAVQWESFGSGGVGLLDRLKEGLERITSLPASAASSVAVTLKRKSTHLAAAQFIGDVFQYLHKRGAKDTPGPIVRTVLDQFRAARELLSPFDPMLIVVGHSLGGVISYDILSHFDVGMDVDVLITVGSQVALFEEMALYLASRPDFNPDPSSDRIPRPTNVKQWLNVLDPNDVFSFRAEGVFSGVKDYTYQTGYGAMAAHSGYFRRPSFYERLGERLAQGDE